MIALPYTSLPKRERKLGLALLEVFILEQFADRHDDLVAVRQLDAHGVLAGNRREDVDALGPGGAGEVGFEIGDAAHAQAIARDTLRSG